MPEKKMSKQVGLQCLAQGQSDRKYPVTVAGIESATFYCRTVTKAVLPHRDLTPY